MVAFLYCFSCVIMLFVTLLTLAKRFFPDGKTEMEIMLDERCSNLPKINEQAYQTLIESEIGEYIRIGAYIIDVSDWLTEHPGGHSSFVTVKMTRDWNFRMWLTHRRQCKRSRN